MTKEELSDAGVSIESYGGGFIIADYSGKTETRFGARYCGESKEWRDQPVVRDPFQTEEEAVKAASEVFA
jgi:hypothetical protein